MNTQRQQTKIVCFCDPSSFVSFHCRSTFGLPLACFLVLVDLEGMVIAFGGSLKTGREEHLIVGTIFMSTLLILRSYVFGLVISASAIDL